MDGVVIRRNVELGQTVAASLQAPTLFTIAHDLRAMKVEVKVDEADIGQIREGQPVTFTVDSYPDRRFVGTVEQIRKAHEIFQNVVTYTVIVSADNDDLALFPGMTAVVHIVVDQAREVLRVPNAALRYTPKAAPGAPEASPTTPAATVWQLDGAGLPMPVPVTLGASDSRHTAVTADGLAAGDEVITAEVREHPEGVHGRAAAMVHDLQQDLRGGWRWLVTRLAGPSAAR
jgi:HlyD family secretion protein